MEVLLEPEMDERDGWRLPTARLVPKLFTADMVTSPSTCSLGTSFYFKNILCNIYGLIIVKYVN